MKACAACGNEVEESDLFMSDRGEICAVCNLDDEVAPQSGFNPMALVGLGAGVVPFFMSMSSGSSTTLNGVVVKSSFIDYIAVGGGGVALVAGALALLGAKKAGPKRGQVLMVGGAAVALGVYQLLRGFGQI